MEYPVEGSQVAIAGEGFLFLNPWKPVASQHNCFKLEEAMVTQYRNSIYPYTFNRRFTLVHLYPAYLILLHVRIIL